MTIRDRLTGQTQMTEALILSLVLEEKTIWIAFWILALGAGLMSLDHPARERI